MADRQFKKGERYVLVPYDEVSQKERGFYFASINEAWGNLSGERPAPDTPSPAERFKSPNHLRKWALIESGWCRENFTVCDSQTRATQLAAFIYNMDDTATVMVEDRVVRVWIARSQRVAPDAMSVEEWRKSKQDVLDILSGTIGVSRKALEKQGRLLPT